MSNTTPTETTAHKIIVLERAIVKAMNAQVYWAVYDYVGSMLLCIRILDTEAELIYYLDR